jgi:hypothetical protein
MRQEEIVTSDNLRRGIGQPHFPKYDRKVIGMEIWFT